MLSKSTRLVQVAIVAATAITILLFQQNGYSVKTTDYANRELVAAKAGTPVRINIPSINVNAEVEQTGTTADGAMGIPKLPQNTAWYNLGTKPGDIGSAVIDGHFDWKFGAKAVFSDLGKLKAGDLLTTEDNQGVITTFKVTDTKSYPPNADTTGIFLSTDDKAHLNLITCSGSWDQKINSYNQRLVVFTEKQ